MIERGMTPPPVLPEEKKTFTADDSLRRGTVLVFLGLGFGVGYLVLRGVSNGPPSWLAGVTGAIVGFLGLGYLAYYIIARRRPQSAARGDQMTT